MATYNPRTGITSYKEEYNLDDVLGGEPVPSASAATAPADASAAPAPGMFDAPAAPWVQPTPPWQAFAQNRAEFTMPGMPGDYVPQQQVRVGSGQDSVMQYLFPDEFNALFPESSFAPYRTGGWQDGRTVSVYDQRLNKFDELVQKYHDQQNTLRQARSNLLYNIDPTLAQHIYADLPSYGLTEDQFVDEWFGEAALEREIARLTAPEHDKGELGKFMTDLGDHGTIELVAKLALAWMLGGAGAGMAGAAGAAPGGVATGAAAGATAGGGMAGMSGGNVLEGAVLGGLTGGAASYAGGAASGLEGVGPEGLSGAWQAIPAGVRQAAFQIGAQALASGGDVKGAVMGYLIQQGVNGASSLAADVANDLMRNGTVAEVGLSAHGMFADADVADPTKRFQFADAGTSTFDVSAPLMPPAGATPMTGEYPMPAAIPTSTAEQAASTLGSPAFLPGYDVAYGGMLAAAALTPEQEAADAENLQTLEAGDAPVPEPTVTAEDVTKYAKLSKTLYDLLNPDSPSGEGEAPAPADAPAAPAEDATEEDRVAYAEQLVTYANLDAAAMAEQGLTPGTPAYYEYVMTQMDSIIAQVLEGVDVDSADLATQLRAKTAEELVALERALFVRGQIGQLMGSGTYTDPATGLDEEVIAPDGEQVNPARAAYMRGLARNADSLGRLRGGGARDFLGGMLGRDADMFGMQGRADERAELEEQFLLEDERKRRRGMFAMGY